MRFWLGVVDAAPWEGYVVARYFARGPWERSSGAGRLVPNGRLGTAGAGCFAVRVVWGQTIRALGRGALHASGRPGVPAARSLGGCCVVATVVRACLIGGPGGQPAVDRCPGWAARAPRPRPRARPRISVAWFRC